MGKHLTCTSESWVVLIFILIGWWHPWRVFFQTIDWQSKTKANKSLPNDTGNDQRKKFKPQTFSTLRTVPPYIHVHMPPTLNTCTPLFPPNYKHSNANLHALVWSEHDFIFGVGTAGLKLSTSWTCAYNILTFRQIKGVTMATSCHVASPWHLAHWTLMENEWTYLSKRLTMNQDAGEQGQAKAKSYKGTQRKPEGQNCPTVPHNTCPRG